MKICQPARIPAPRRVNSPNRFQDIIERSQEKKMACDSCNPPESASEPQGDRTCYYCEVTDPDVKRLHAIDVWVCENPTDCNRRMLPFAEIDDEREPLRG